MTCTDCQTKHTYNMTCLHCAARHCKQAFYPTPKMKLPYVQAIARKYNHDAEILLNEIKSIAQNR